MVQAKLHILDKQFQMAENIYMENGKIEEAMDMYQELHKWDKSIKVAEVKNHPELQTLKRNYMQWLIDSGQEGKAGDYKVEEGDYFSAISLYLKGGVPMKAANLLPHSGLEHNLEIIERIASSLFACGQYDKAGELFQRANLIDKAMDSYKKGHAFGAAVDLARISYPEQVIKLEEQWGDYLASNRQLDASINHFIESGNMIKAIDAAIGSKQWKKAVSILESVQNIDSIKRYYIPLAQHFSEVEDYALAEKFYIEAKRPNDAVAMYSNAHQWEQAHKVACTFMNPKEVSDLYIKQAKDLEAKGQLKDAEKLYLTIKEHDMAINMYKNNRQYDQMIKLVSIYHKELLSKFDG